MVPGSLLGEPGCPGDRSWGGEASWKCRVCLTRSPTFSNFVFGRKNLPASYSSVVTSSWHGWVTGWNPQNIYSSWGPKSCVVSNQVEKSHGA